MKALYPFLLLLICGAVVVAQPTLTYDDVPDVGNSYSIFNYNPDGVEPGPAGSGLTWDFSILGAPSTDTIYLNIIEPDSSPHIGLFPSCNLVAEILNSVNNSVLETFVTVDPAKWQTMGSYVSNPVQDVTNIFGDLRTEIEFPFTMGSSFSDTYAFEILPSPFTIYTKGVRTVTADGWGTIVTPDGTYSNALRLFTTMFDTTSVFGITTISKLYQWSWYPENGMIAVFDIVKDTIWTGPIREEVLSEVKTTNQTGGTPSGMENAWSDEVLMLYEPGMDNVVVQVLINRPASLTIALYSIDGRKIQEQNWPGLPAGKRDFRLPVSGLSPGMYIMSLYNGENRLSQKLIVN